MRSVRLLTRYSWDDATIAERYSGEAGEEYKERLSAKIEDRPYVPGTKAAPITTAASVPPPYSATSRSHTPLGGTSSPPRAGKVKVDDKFFAGLGAANASRSTDLPPSQGGKYAGFGSTPIVRRDEGKLPGLDDLQRDPVAALTKGFGWFASTVGKTAKTVNEGYIQPTALKVPTPAHLPAAGSRPSSKTPPRPMRASHLEPGLVSRSVDSA